MNRSLVITIIVIIVVGAGILFAFYVFRTMTGEPAPQEPVAEQPTVASPDIVPPPPEVIADIQQEGYSEEQREYLELIQEAPNQDIDIFQAELGL